MENQKEIWVDVLGLEGFYQVSNFSNVRSLDRITKMNSKQPFRKVKGRAIKNSLNTNGYLTFNMTKNGIKKLTSIHRLVALHFIPNPENKPCVNHINGIKTDNRIENLEWVTYAENSVHAVETGLCVAVNGEKHPRCKISNLEVVNIRKMKGIKTVSEIAKTYNVVESTIRDILNNKKRKNAEKYI